jgi:hypothetical protein
MVGTPQVNETDWVAPMPPIWQTRTGDRLVLYPTLTRLDYDIRPVWRKGGKQPT